MAMAAPLAVGLLTVVLFVADRHMLLALIRWRSSGSRMLWRALQLAVAVLMGRFLLAGLLSTAQWLRTRRQLLLPRYDSVSVVIAAYNEVDVIGRTVETLLRSRGPALEIIVVDDGSVDGTPALVDRFADRGVQLIKQAHAGKAVALRRGFMASSHAFVVTIDADTVVTPPTIGRLVAPFRDRRVGAVAGNLKVRNQLNFLTRLQSVDYLLTLNLERRAYALLHFVPVMPGALSAWRRRVVLEAGGFAEDTLAEDTDMTLTLAKSGFRTAYAPRAIGYTQAPQSLAALLAQRTRWSFGTLQSLWKHRRRAAPGEATQHASIVMASMWVAQVMMPVLSTFLYVTLLLSPLTGQMKQILVATALYNGVFLVFASWALIVEGESFSRLPLTVAFNLIFRPLSDLVALRVMVLAARGQVVAWRPAARRVAPLVVPDPVPEREVVVTRAMPGRLAG